jgi:hypothetical protein
VLAGEVPPWGHIYHPGDWVDAAAGASGSASSQYSGEGLGSLIATASAENVCSLWDRLAGESDFWIDMSANTDGAAMVEWDCDSFTCSECWMGRQVDWFDIGDHWATCEGDAEAYAADPEETQEPERAGWQGNSEFTVEEEGGGEPPPGGGEGMNLGGVIAASERS